MNYNTIQLKILFIICVLGLTLWYQTKECNNLLTARDNPEIVDELLQAECAKDYAYGPFLRYYLSNTL